jgi:hypothetical protein
MNQWCFGSEWYWQPLRAWIHRSGQRIEFYFEMNPCRIHEIWSRGTVGRILYRERLGGQDYGGAELGRAAASIDTTWRLFLN